MNPPDRVRLQHLADALSSAVRFVRGRERADLDTDEMLLFALVRTVEIAGEAASQVTAETRAQLPICRGTQWSACEIGSSTPISTSIAISCGPPSPKHLLR
jgi:uncharacterized protein with HEPN domain